MSVCRMVSPFSHNFFFHFLCSGSGASMARLAGERRSLAYIRNSTFFMGYIHGQAPKAKKFTHHNIRKKE
jgi:hypothetical protein